jgi:hypothetical protein
MRMGVVELQAVRMEYWWYLIVEMTTNVTVLY